MDLVGRAKLDRQLYLVFLVGLVFGVFYLSSTNFSLQIELGMSIVTAALISRVLPLNFRARVAETGFPRMGILGVGVLIALLVMGPFIMLGRVIGRGNLNTLSCGLFALLLIIVVKQMSKQGSPTYPTTPPPNFQHRVVMAQPMRPGEVYAGQPIPRANPVFPQPVFGQAVVPEALPFGGVTSPQVPIAEPESEEDGES